MECRKFMDILSQIYDVILSDVGLRLKALSQTGSTLAHTNLSPSLGAHWD